MAVESFPLKQHLRLCMMAILNTRLLHTFWIVSVADHVLPCCRQEAHANAVLDYIMFDRVLSSVQSAWLITEAYPLKFNCRALASAVYQLWGHMQLAPGPVLQQQAAVRQQQPMVNVSASLRPQEVTSNAMLQPTQQQQNALHGVGAAPGSRLDAQQTGNLRQQLQASQQLGMQHVPASLSLAEAQRSAGLTQAALAHQQQQQSLQQQQVQQRSVQPQQATGSQALHNPLSRQTMAGQRPLPASAGLLQGQGIDKWQWQQMLQQQMGMPVRQQGPGVHQLAAAQQASARQPTAGLLDQRLRGLGALQGSSAVLGSSAMLAGAVPRPAGARLPMVVP